MALFKWPARDPGEPVRPAAPASTDSLTATKVFPRFLSSLAHREGPVLVDLGPVVGANVEFFGERLACRIHVVDLYAEIEAHAREGGEPLGERCCRRLSALPAGGVDGVLCWDVFDYLGRSDALRLSAAVAALVGRGGLVHGFFGTTPVTLSHHTRFVVQAEDTFRLRPVRATSVVRQVLPSRDIARLFPSLDVVETVLLKTSTRETLFRRGTSPG